tara:strand:- start:720 stop:1409 length:690 start_codon:yes stop_codon:yes gene_type:complete
MIKQSDKISVLISVFNGEKTINKSIESILDQTYNNFEILLMNDGSTDKTEDLLKDYTDKFSNILYFKNEKNMGLTFSLNFLIKKSNGTYLARQDADDVSYRNRFQRQISAIVKNNLDFCTSRALIKGTNKKIPGFSYLIPYQYLIKYKNPFIHGSLMIKKEVMNEIGLYNTKFKYAQDYKLFFDLIKKNYNFKTINEPLYELNMSDNISTNKKIEQKYFADCVRNGSEP